MTPEQRKALIDQPFPTFASPNQSALMALPDSVRARLTGPVQVLPTSYKWAGTIVGDRFFNTSGEMPQGRGRHTDESNYSFPDPSDVE